MVTGVNSNYYNYYNNYQNQYGNYAQTPNFTSNQVQQTAQVQKTSVDGKDDGRISFGSKLKNLGVGALKFVTGMFTDENGSFSLGQTLKTAAIAAGIGAVCVLTAGTAVPAILMATGIAVSGVGVGKAAINAALADTDAEAEQAWQSLGSNGVALGLSVAGAKAVAKSGATAEEAAQFSGVKGAGKAIKHVFEESYKPVAKSFEGVKDAYQGATAWDKVSNVGSKVKSNITAQAEEFSAQVGKNFNNTIYGTSSKIDNEITQLDKKKTALEKQRDSIADKASKEYKNLDNRVKTIEAQKQAMQEINQATSWESANSKIEANRNALTKKKEALKTAKGDAKDAINQEIAQLENTIKNQEYVLERRTAEVRALDSRIEALTKAKTDAKTPEAIAKYDAKIADLQARRTSANFELPQKPANEVKLSDLAKNPINELNAQKRLFLAERKINSNEVIKNPIEYAKAYDEYLNAKAEVATLRNKTVADAQAYKVQQLATPGGFKTHAAKEVLNASKDILTEGTVKNHILRPEGNTAQWLTVGIAGRQFGETAEVRFYNQLSPEEQKIFKNLPYKQKQALINTYVQVA